MSSKMTSWLEVNLAHGLQGRRGCACSGGGGGWMRAGRGLSTRGVYVCGIGMREGCRAHLPSLDGQFLVHLASKALSLGCSLRR